jgi:hypothetical protein
MPTALYFLALFGVLVLLVSLLAPAGWGLPGPIFGLLFLLFAGPGLMISWFLYRRAVKSGEVPPISAGTPGANEEASRPVEREPNRDEARRRVSSFRRAAGDE